MNGCNEMDDRVLGRYESFSIELEQRVNLRREMGVLLFALACLFCSTAERGKRKAGF